VQAIILAAKTMALMAGRYNVSKDDVHRAAVPALRHRVLLNYEADADRMTSDKLIASLLFSLQAKDRDPVQAIGRRAQVRILVGALRKTTS